MEGTGGAGSSGMFESLTRSTASSSKPMKKFYKGEPMALGITQLLTGFMQLAFGIVGDMVNYQADFFTFYIKTPHWTGILYIFSGSLSVAAAKKPKIPLVKAMLAMNVVSTVAAGIAIVTFSMSLAFHRPGRYYSHDCIYDYSTQDAIQKCQESIKEIYAVMHAMGAVLLIFNILEFTIALTSAAFGCSTLCRDSYSETTVVIFQNIGEAPTTPALQTPLKEDIMP